MSRDLVTFNRTERDRKNKDAVERLCTDMGCSEPVARNFLKYQKFGIGPLADFGAARQRAQRPRSSEGDEEASDPLQRGKRVQDLEKRLQEQKEKEEREEQEMLEEMKKKRQSKRAGLKPLGPVMAREEAVDPLQKVATEAPELEEPQAPAPDDANTGQWLSVPRQAVDWKKEEEEKKRKLQEQQHHKHKKKKKRRREDEEKSEESEHARRRQLLRSRSVEEEPRKGSSSSGGLMTEKEVLAMMGKEKAKEKPQRGSMQAKLRIQREMQEWNSTKAENEEFWKAPRFALCYSAETSRTLRGNTGPNVADAHRKGN